MNNAGKKVKLDKSPAAGCSSSAPPPPWIELPRDVTENILRRLGPEEILDRAQKVCATWRSVCREPSLWRVFDLKYYGKHPTPDQAISLCRRAVDLSQGELVDINIQRFGNNDLLRYISERCSHLKILSLEFCFDISPKVLTSAVKNFPHLEELHLFFISPISALDIEAIGDSCPMLKSFTLYNDILLVLKKKSIVLFLSSIMFYTQKGIDNNQALSIAKKMPNLLRLCLFSNNLSNEGLLAILDGCPNLVSLDLGRCYEVNLEGTIGRRCLEQIKELRGPSYEQDDRFYDPKLDSSFVFEDLDDFSDDFPLSSMFEMSLLLEA